MMAQVQTHWNSPQMRVIQKVVCSIWYPGTYEHIHGILTCSIVWANHKLLFEEEAENQKAKDARRKKARSKHHCDKLVGKLVVSHNTPPAAPAFARALQEWLKFMLRVPHKYKDTKADLPDYLTEDKKTRWIKEGDSREALNQATSCAMP